MQDISSSAAQAPSGAAAEAATPPGAAPLVPAACDLRNFLRMPLQVGRLLDSGTWIEAAADPRLGHALMSLWAASWQQVPTGSMPDSDAVLCRLSLCPDQAEWRRIKAQALAGWVRCSDGRLYHPVVCEMALECWLAKLAARLKGGRGNASQHGVVFDEAGLMDQLEQAHRMLQVLNPMSEALAKVQSILKPRRGRVGGAAAGGGNGASADGSGATGGQSALPGIDPLANAGANAGASAQRTHCERTANALRTQVRTQQRTQGKGRDLSPLPPVQCQPVDNFDHGPHGDPPGERLPWRWWTSRRGIEAAGQSLGCGAWNEAASQCGEGEHWPAYRERVFSTAGADGPWWQEVGGSSAARSVGQALQAARVH